MLAKIRTAVSKLLYLFLGVSIVSGAGATLAKSMSLRTETAYTFPIILAAVAIVSVEMGRAFQNPTNQITHLILFFASVSMIAGMIWIVMLGGILVGITDSLSHLLYFFLIFVEWIFINVFW